MHTSSRRQGALPHAACRRPGVGLGREDRSLPAAPPPPATRGRRSQAGSTGERRRLARAAAMDRFVWTSGLLEINETLVIQQRGVRVYDGEEKVGRRPTRPAGPHAGPGLPRPGSPGSRPRPRGPRCTVDGGGARRGGPEVSGEGEGGRSPGQSSSALSGARHRNAFPTLLLDG